MKNKVRTNQDPLSEIPPEMKVTMQMVLNGLGSRNSIPNYRRSLHDFLCYWHRQGQPVPDKLFLQTYLQYMLENGIGKHSINTRLGAIRNFASEAVDMEIWSNKVISDFSRVKRIPVRGSRSGNWLTLEQAQELIDAPDTSSPIGLRDRAILALMLGCGLRRNEVTSVDVEHIQQRESVWVLADIVGKRNRKRTVVIADWVKQIINEYLEVVKIRNGRLIRAMNMNGRLIRPTLSSHTLFITVRKYARMCGLPDISPHDLRRTYAKLAYQNGAKLDQIQINLGHSSLTTTQVYLGLNLDLDDGPGSYLDIEV